MDGGWVESATRACLRCRLSLMGVKRRDHRREGRHIHDWQEGDHRASVQRSMFLERVDEEECQTQARRRRRNIRMRVGTGGLDVRVVG